MRKGRHQVQRGWEGLHAHCLCDMGRVPGLTWLWVLTGVRAVLGDFHDLGHAESPHNLLRKLGHTTKLHSSPEPQTHNMGDKGPLDEDIVFNVTKTEKK